MSAKVFAFSGPKIWNLLKLEWLNAAHGDTLTNFKRKLKTDLCKTAYKDS